MDRSGPSAVFVICRLSLERGGPARWVDGLAKIAVSRSAGLLRWSVRGAGSCFQQGRRPAYFAACARTCQIAPVRFRAARVLQISAISLMVLLAYSMANTAILAGFSSE